MIQLKLTLPCSILIFILIFTDLFSQEPQFQREVDTVPVIVDGVPVHSPFAGGINFSKPCFADIDTDGDFDLFVGKSDGNINFYRNTGTASNPTFTFVTENPSSIDVGLDSAPTFTDIDNDGDFDLFVGESGGNINFYRNTGTTSIPTFTLETENFVSINVGIFSTPTFADIDNDGDFDLFVGENDGNINYYRNTGSASNPILTLETEDLGSIDVGSESTPTFADIDNDGDSDLFVGQNFRGSINFYRNTGTSSSPIFTLETEDFASINVGANSAPTFADIDDDGDFDLFVGESAGNVVFYRNTGTASNPSFTLEESIGSIDNGDLSIPTFADIDDDGDFDLFVGEGAGNINFYRNTGTSSSPIFTLETENFATIDVGANSAPAFADIDNDGDFDLFVGESAGNINFYRNTGTASNPIFTLETEDLASINVGTRSAPTFADSDNDGDFDLFVGKFFLNINFYRNTGTTSNPIFTLESENLVSANVGFYSTPTFADIDDDEDFDLFVGEDDGNINFYRNTGGASNPDFTLLTENFADIGVNSKSAPTFADIDDDGDSDLLVGESGGGLHFYRNITAGEPVQGDVNSDGIVNVNDLIAAINFILRLSTPTDEQFAAADVNGDGALNVSDLIGIINIILGIG